MCLSGMHISLPIIPSLSFHVVFYQDRCDYVHHMTERRVVMNHIFHVYLTAVIAIIGSAVDVYQSITPLDMYSYVLTKTVYSCTN